MTYADAMRDYCSDKPDLRNPLKVVDLTEGLATSEFSVFNGKTIKAIKATCADKGRKWYDAMTKFVIDNEGKGLCWFKYNDNQLSGSAVKFLKEDEQKYILETLGVQNGDSIFIIADTAPRATKLISTLRNKLGTELNILSDDFKFVWIVDFPFFEEEDGQIQFSHNPFSMPQGELDALLNKNPLEILAYQYDLVLNGVELLSGAVRNHNPQVMVKAFEMAGYDRSVVENKFPALFNAFDYGAPPHAGCAFGFDRLLMFLCNTDIIRDVIAFPLNKSAQDLMMSAPSTVTEQQLRDVSIKIDIND